MCFNKCFLGMFIFFVWFFMLCMSLILFKLNLYLRSLNDVTMVFVVSFVFFLLFWCDFVIVSVYFLNVLGNCLVINFIVV